MHQITILVGSQWGDEGKGKWVDVLSAEHDIAVRFQGGDNAGHTLHVDGEKHIFHHLPSSVLHQNMISGLLSGTVVNPLNLLAEIKQLSPTVALNKDCFWLSSRCHVITPWHLVKDQSEEAQAAVALGTTLKGIGPCYTDKVARHGLLMAHYIDAKKSEQWLERYKIYDPAFSDFVSQNSQVMVDFFAARAELKPYVCPLEARLRSALHNNQRVLCEGAQGTLLDLCHGTYPFVTSSHTVASGALVSMGIGLQYSTKVIGVAKAYVTRVGEGPFPSELMGSDGQKLARIGHEFGATTGRARRCGWLDGVALRYACQVNGVDELYLNKCDVLSSFDEVKLCTAYQHAKYGLLQEFPEDVTEYPYLSCVYETFKGWSELSSVSGRGKVPAELSDYLRRIEEICGVSIGRIGTGPKREDYIVLK